MTILTNVYGHRLNENKKIGVNVYSKLPSGIVCSSANYNYHVPTNFLLYCYVFYDIEFYFILLYLLYDWLDL
jgi:hypothetical protein